jgi:hypothetical protein
MLLATLTFSARDWLWPTAMLSAAILLAVIWSYRARSTPRLGWLYAGLKLLGIGALAFCLLDPLRSGQRARPGANMFAILVDNSQSLRVKDGKANESRAESIEALLDPLRENWQAALEDNFEIRRFFFDTRLQSTRDFHELTYNGRATALQSALSALKSRFEGRPLAGVLLLTDGNATDLRSASADLAGLPPVYPLVIGRSSAFSDLAIGQVNITQTAFEDAPVSIQAEVAAVGLAGETAVAELALLGASSSLPALSSTLPVRKNNDVLAFRFELRPQKSGISFYQLRVRLKDELSATSSSHKPKTGTRDEPSPPPASQPDMDTPSASKEATLLNNTRVLAVDRGQGPYRVLYVSGRPNWEYKFMNRAVQEDPQLQLVGLIRIASREAKFDFRGRGGETSNPLFRGFGNQAREDAERYDQPVLARLNTKDEFELRNGFPTKPEELYAFQAVIIDDLEAAFFTPDQAALLQRFVSERGGGLLMFGGMESFQQGRYQRTPIGDMLPIYLDRTGNVPAFGETGATGTGMLAPGNFRFNLAREGWLQAWARLRDNEADERTRLEAMPAFQVFNPSREIKPGAVIVATATDSQGKEYPALATQRFGHGRTAALMIGDLWRWGMKNPDAHRDLDKAWRQLARWLVADVPRQIQLTVESGTDTGAEGVNLQVRARDSKFQVLEDAAVTIEVQPAPVAGGAGLGEPVVSIPVRMRAEPSPKEPGLYETSYVPHGTGGYFARAWATNSVGLEVGRAEAGWNTDLAAEEFRSLQPNLPLLAEIARRTGGEIISAGSLVDFARQLPKRSAPLMEPWTVPAWHTPAVFAFALACFVTEWGLRRWKGLP